MSMEGPDSFMKLPFRSTEYLFGSAADVSCGANARMHLSKVGAAAAREHHPEIHVAAFLSMYEKFWRVRKPALIASSSLEPDMYRVILTISTSVEPWVADIKLSKADSARAGQPWNKIMKVVLW